MECKIKFYSSGIAILSLSRPTHRWNSLSPAQSRTHFRPTISAQPPLTRIFALAPDGATMPTVDCLIDSRGIAEYHAMTRQYNFYYDEVM